MFKITVVQNIFYLHQLYFREEILFGTSSHKKNITTLATVIQNYIY